MKKMLSKVCQFMPIVLLFFSIGCNKTIDKPSVAVNETQDKSIPPQETKDFTQVNLVGDNNDLSPSHIDANLVNAWGIAFPASGPAWVSSQGGSLGLIFNGDGTAARPPVTIPNHTEATGGHPTGIVVNNTTDFKLPNGNPAKFIFAEAEGVISAWNGGNAAIRVADDILNPFYFGIALASDGSNNFLYIANFTESKIEVYDKNFTEVSKPFTDPDLPSGYSPFNIQNIDGKLYVMYAKLGVKPGDIVSVSPGNGFVDIFNPDGSFVKRFISQGQLNAPWGITKAPAGFWGENADSQDIILVGNFGDGHINAYNSEGVFQGELRTHGNPIVIERLWGMAFAPATSTSIDHNSLYFAAGPGAEKHGLFGLIKK